LPGNGHEWIFQREQAFASKATRAMKPANLKTLEWIVSILLSAVILLLLLVRAQHAGALWRDECASVQLAEMPAAVDVLNNFQRESFPAVFPFTIRAWAALFGTSDAAFRAFGFFVGLMLLVVVWINARLLTDGPPLLAPVLLGLNTTFLIWGTGIRGYGIGSVLILLAFGLVAKMLVEPTNARIAAALVACLASVQFLLYNSVLLVAIALAGLTVSMLRRNVRGGVALVVICLLCALSMLPQLGPFRYESQSTVVFQGPVGFAWFSEQLALALGSPAPVMVVVWTVLGLAVIAGAVIRFCTIWSKKPLPEWDYLLYGLLVAIASKSLYLIFLKIVSYRTREWYYLALIAILAGAIDLLAANLARIRWVRILRLVFVIAALTGLTCAAWPKVIERQSNMDIVARNLAEAARPNDLIVVNPWFLGVAFNWYYRGSAPWLSCPTMDDHRMHRFDLLKEKLQATAPIDDLLGRIRATLESGNRVWFVGDVKILPPDRMPVKLPPAPNSEFGWSGDAYAESWSQQLGDLLRTHAGSAQFIRVSVVQPVNELENVPVLVAAGWRE
jgi:hypothetical protein